jgi:hypothetical protein
MPASKGMTQDLNEEKEMADWIRTNTTAMLTRLFPETQNPPLPNRK